MCPSGLRGIRSLASTGAVQPVPAACTLGAAGGEGEQPFTATALGSADRPGFASAGSVQV